MFGEKGAAEGVEGGVTKEVEEKDKEDTRDIREIIEEEEKRRIYPALEREMDKWRKLDLLIGELDDEFENPMAKAIEEKVHIEIWNIGERLDLYKKVSQEKAEELNRRYDELKQKAEQAATDLREFEIRELEIGREEKRRRFNI